MPWVHVEYSWTSSAGDIGIEQSRTIVQTEINLNAEPKWSSNAHRTVCFCPPVNVLPQRAPHGTWESTRHRVRPWNSTADSCFRWCFLPTVLSNWAWAKPASICDGSSNLEFSPLHNECGPLIHSTAIALGLLLYFDPSACRLGVGSKPSRHKERLRCTAL